MSELPTGTVTFLFTDLEGSTRLWEEQPDAMQGALARHDEILRDAIISHDGHIVKTTGDGVHAAFADATSAVRAARDAQVALASNSWGDTGALRVRIGIHTGPAERREGDYYGTAVNRAARLMSIANGGQVVVSLTTEELLRDDMPEGCSLVDLGEHGLRDLLRPERVFQLDHPDLARQFPPLRSLDAFRGNLPLQSTSFVGRDHEITALADALNASRLVTLTGVGGVGKTRLAIQVAAELLPGYPDGAWLCELAAASDPDAMVQVVAATLGIQPRAGASLQSGILDFLRSKELLLVLDNCEHLLDTAAEFAAGVLRECGSVRLLATSREGLAISGEQVWPLRSLADDQAAELFGERAQSVAPATAVDTHDVAVAEICRRLDGIPLAIELAAARVVALGPAEIAARLDERFRLLTGGRRTAVERHQTLQATVDWSYSMLEPSTQAVFTRLGVFSGTFDVGAAEAVASGEGIELWDVVDAVTDLATKSMVVTEPGEYATRYRLLETMRAYARERLDETGGADTWRRRHAQHYAHVAEELGAALMGPDELRERHRFHDDLDNLRAAFNWALDRDVTEDVELGVAIVAALAMQAQADVASGVGVWAGRALAHLDDSSPAHRHAVGGAAAFTLLQQLGDLERARDVSLTAIANGVPAGSPAASLAHITLGMVHAYTEDWDRCFAVLADGQHALEAVEAGPFFLSSLHSTISLFHGSLARIEDARREADIALGLARAIPNPSALALALFAVAWGTWQNDPAAALVAAEESVALTRAGAVNAGFGPALAIAARCRAETGDLAGAFDALRQGVAFSHGAGDLTNLGFTLYDTVGFLLQYGDVDTAAELIGALQSGLPLWVVGGEEDARRVRAVAQTRAALGDAAFDAACATGAAMPMDDVVDAVLTTLDRLSSEAADA